MLSILEPRQRSHGALDSGISAKNWCPASVGSEHMTARGLGSMVTTNIVEWQGVDCFGRCKILLPNSIPFEGEIDQI